VSKDSRNSQNANSPQNVERDEVLKRMLKTKPLPHGKFKKNENSQQLNFAHSKDYADTNISTRNKR
jgi:hypothetical protein